jgi:hypothetical protein
VGQGDLRGSGLQVFLHPTGPTIAWGEEPTISLPAGLGAWLVGALAGAQGASAHARGFCYWRVFTTKVAPASYTVSKPSSWKSAR